MAPTIPTVVPSAFRAGDTVQFTRAYTDFPLADGWAFTCTLSGEGKLAVTHTASGSDALFTLAAADTASLPPGTYRVAITAALSGARYTAEETQLTVQADIAAATAGSLRSHDEQVLQALEAEILARASSDHTEYAVDGRSLKRESLEFLTAWAQRLRARIARKRAGRLLMISSHFTRAGGGVTE